ncbi:hypothetical protein GDO81_022427, partial [Engystomops pustulosus]
MTTMLYSRTGLDATFMCPGCPGASFLRSGLFYLLLFAHNSQGQACEKSPCFSGRCVNSTCVCDPGWVGEQCRHCQGRFKLTEPSGYLTDGPINYKYKTKCTWLIEGYSNAVLRLRFNHFATECSWDHMYVYDGDSIYSPLIAVLSFLFSLSDFSLYFSGSNTWLVPETRGAIVQGGYGHTSVYDPITKAAYVHGGYKALPGNKYGLVDDLYRYEVNTRTWMILKESGLSRYLHSAVLISGAMLVFGGNTHNDTSLSNGAKCFSADFLAYDI